LTVAHRRVSYPLRSDPIRRRKYRSVSRWIAVSGEIGDLLRSAGVADERIRIVASAIDVDAFRAAATAADPRVLRRELAIPDGAPVVGLTGALEPQKGHLALIRAARMIHDAAPDAVFLCPGEGSFRRTLEREVHDRGLAASFVFPGFRSDVAAVTNLYDVAVVPSGEGEGSSAAIKEALALGKGVAVSDLGGNREVVGDAGAVVPVDDSGRLADAVAELLTDPQVRRAFADRAASRVELFRSHRMVESVVDIYRELLSERRTAEGAA
jgi:glycosyltransferase involved in cell wall biosynthesis